MKRIIILAVAVLLVSGCSGNLDIKIHNNGKVSENITISENKSNSEFDSEQEFKTYVNDIKKTYFQSSEIDGYESDDKLSNGKYISNYKKIYTDKLCKNILDSSLKNIISDINCTKKGNKYTLTGTADYFITEEITDDYEGAEVGDYYNIDSLELVINLPGKALKNNADKVIGSKYTWNFKMQEEPQKILIEFKLSKFNVIKKVLIVILVLVAINVPIVLFLKSKYKANRLDY